ncbi:amino acid adenylation domain-containing protein [Amycolatopsis sp. BJA-103]|uniref:non-ribosomal peptide synthetase n=1 Tax=Amycolatopsis sp. BJA-103 TaxID=1911175 RepID=UPI000C78FF4C|nr:non-ribosomal peptide synthetase [Amycolatopsis sp. BJA-103]AUI61786.1 thioester reductase [Amycolatopsis sp. BJA-103]PNE20916.1 thioester reductase [Amycolatopsis sp. BJA-103]
MTAFSIPTRFAEQVARTPEAAAVSEAASGTALTYRELDHRANQLAHHLIGLGVGHEDRVAVLVERSIGLVVAFLAILKAGATYLPIHEAYPADRRQWVVDHAGATVLLVDDATRAAGVPTGVPVVAVGDPALADEPAADPEVPIHPDQLAYVIHTSGSTGQPKGVAVTQRDVVRLLSDPKWSVERYARLLLLAPYAFDISIFEIWMPLLHGGQVVIAPPGRLEPTTLRQLITTHQITGLHLTAGLFRVIAEEAPETLIGLREILTGGDVISPVAVRRVLDVCPDVVVRATYGATEGTVLSTRHLLTRGTELGAVVPIGDALTEITIHILDAHLAQVPADVVGEIYLAGEGVARGYLGQTDLTAERFVADPFGLPGARMYRTGDLARRTTEGLIEFVGREDSQVKILGFLVELAEVESALAGYPGLAQFVVLARELEHGEKQLVGYVVPEAGELDLAALRAYARTKLPDYMVPAVFVELDSLPLTANGKVDRAAMPEPDFAEVPTYRAPETSLQQRLCEIFSSVLDVPEVGIDDSFFDLGGQSLQAMRLLNRIKGEVGVEVLINVLFDFPTVAELTAHIEAKQSSAA